MIDVVEKLDSTTIAVVGLAKNCGKTTALNCLLREYAEAGIGLGVTSAGLDGETKDTLTGCPKPPIEIPSGTLAATAAKTLENWSAPKEVLSGLGVSGAMGEVLLVRATDSGTAELAGPQTVEGVVQAINRLKRLGAERILIDGALDRIAVGHPGLADAVVLAGGAVLAGSATSVARIVGDKVILLDLPTPSDDVRWRLAEVAERIGSRAAAVTENFSVTELSETALSDPKKAAEAARSAKWLVCGGALSDDVVRSLQTANAPVDIVVRDATRIFVDPRTLERWKVSGGYVLVLTRMRLAAIVTNPHNPTGTDLDPEELIDAVGTAVKDIPIFDVVAGLTRNT